MSWVNLGTLLLKEDWKAFPVPVDSSEIFRITHAVDRNLVSYCWLAQAFIQPFPGGRLDGWKRLYPSQESYLIHLPIPSGFKSEGFTMFNLEAKIRIPYFDKTPWEIMIEAWKHDG